MLMGLRAAARLKASAEKATRSGPKGQPYFYNKDPTASP